MGRDDEYDEEVDGKIAFVSYLIEAEVLATDKAFGVARKFVGERSTKGFSEKQLYVFEKQVLCHKVSNCGQCGRPIEWSEMQEVLERDGRTCEDCVSRREKIMAE